MSRRVTGSVVAWAVLAAACGARTGLNVPDVAFPEDATIDAPDVVDVVDVVDVRPPTCATGRFTLTQRGADMMLVVDRSGSMGQRLGAARSGPSKWVLLRDALAGTLPAFQGRIGTGALFYPQDGAETRVSTCALPNIPSVDINPALNTASRVIDVFHETGPGGSTPTAAALLRAYTWFVRNPNRARARYLVLATDGGPNCNAALDPRRCVCVGGALGGAGGLSCARDGDGLRCLDRDRTVNEIRDMVTNPVASIPTFVIGLADDSDASYAATLTAMAVAGGRPFFNARGEPTYYNVQVASDLTQAFTTIQETVSRCAFVTPSRPGVTGSIVLSAGGAVVPADPSRRNGWDWTDRAFGEITLFGPACDNVIAARTTEVVANVVCEADGG